MIRGIFIALLMFCHGALAQQAPTEFVPSTCNISPNPGENSLNWGQIKSQMIGLGLAKPSEAQVRCIMNTPREGRKAKLQEMIAAQQGQQQLTPEQAAFLKTKTFPDSVFSLPVKNIGVENQLMVIDGFQKLNFIIELSPEIVAKVPLDKNMPLYCKTPTCTLVFSNRMTTNPPVTPIFTANGDFDIRLPSGQNPPPPQTTGPSGQATPPSPITVTNDLVFIKNQGQLISVQLPNRTMIGIDRALYSSIANSITPTLKCSPDKPCTLFYTNQFQSYTSGTQTASLPVYTFQVTPTIWDGDSPGKNPPSGQGGPPPTLAQQYPDIPFKSGQPPLMISPTGNTNILSALLPETKQIFFVAIPLPQGQNPTVTCKDNTCAFKIKALQGTQPIYELTGNYNNITTTPVAPPAPPETLSFGTQGIALTKTALGENHIMALYPPDRYIAIRFDDYNLSLVLTKNKPMLTCNPTPNNTCSLVKTGVIGVPEKSKYIIKEGSSTIVDAEPSPAGTPGGTQQPQFLPEITIPKDTLIPGQRIAMSDQVVTKNNNPEYTMLIELAPDTLKNAQPGSGVNLKCTSETCKLTDSKNRTAPPEKPIYTVTGGTLVLADTPTPAQVVPGGTQQPQGATPGATPQGGQVAVPAPAPAAKKNPYAQTFEYKKDVSFDVKKIGSNQVVALIPVPNVFAGMSIQLDETLASQVPTDQSVKIKCTTDTCTLNKSGKLSDTDQMPIYTVATGTFALDDINSGQQNMDKPAASATTAQKKPDQVAAPPAAAPAKDTTRVAARGARPNQNQGPGITLNQNETIAVSKTKTNQIRATYGQSNVMIELDPNLMNKLSVDTTVLLKCTAKTCSLQNSGNLSDPDGMPIYTVGAGSTFALEDTATPTPTPAPGTNPQPAGGTGADPTPDPNAPEVTPSPPPPPPPPATRVITLKGADQAAVPVPAPTVNQIQYQDITLNKNEIIPVQNRGIRNQVITLHKNPDYNMSIELATEFETKIPPYQTGALSCTTDTCILKDSGNRIGTLKMPIYTVTAGILDIVPNTPVPPSITLDTTGMSFKPDYDKSLPIGQRVLKTDQLEATLNGKNINIKVTADLKNSINDFLNSIEGPDITLKLACSNTAGCPLTAPDAHEPYTVQGVPRIILPAKTPTITKLMKFPKDVSYQVTYVATSYKNTQPTHYIVKFNDKNLGLPMTSITNSSAIATVIARGIALHAATPSSKPFTFKIKCKSDFSCFTSFYKAENEIPIFYGKVEVSE